MQLGLSLWLVQVQLQTALGLELVLVPRFALGLALALAPLSRFALGLALVLAPHSPEAAASGALEDEQLAF